MKQPETLDDLVENFLNFPEKDAIVYKTQYRTLRYSYQELYNNIRKTKKLLERHGIKKGDAVIIWGPNSPWWVTSFLACAAQGVIVVPADLLALEDYIQKIHAQVKAKLIIRTKYKTDPSLEIPTIFLEDLEWIIKNLSLATDKVELLPDDIAEIVFTSGTTDNPKGVILTHRNLLANLSSINQFIKINPHQTFLSLLPLSHLFEQNPGCLLPLSNGATVVYIHALKPSAIFKALTEEKITNMIIVPRLLQVMADGIWHQVKAKGKEKIFAKLLKKSGKWPRWFRKIIFYKIHQKFGYHFRYFICGGANLSLELENFWNNLGFTLLQGYGLTESSPVLTCNPLTNIRIGSVGIPLPNIEIKIDSNGEILARGQNITPGYYKNQQKTSELFTNGWMKTGDIGYLENGYLYLKGRIKNVIITASGVNIYPEDIEKVLLELPQIKDVCVLGVEKGAGEEILAVLLPKDRNNFKADKIIQEANSKLNSSQQILDFFVWPKEDFPRTTTMKIQRRFVMEEIVKLRKTKNDSGTAILSDRQRKLYRIVAEITKKDINSIFGHSRLGLDLKLSSISRVELLSFLEQEFNLDINEDAITNETTVGDLENIIAKRERAETSKKQREWVFGWFMRLIRLLHHYFFAFPILSFFLRLNKQGLDYLKNLRGSVIFVSNHTSYLDTPMIYRALPLRFLNKIAVGAHREFFEKTKNGKVYIPWYSISFNYTTMFMAAYMFPRTKEFKQTLEYTGRLIDKGWNILIFPEGKHTTTGEMMEFKEGVGIMATSMRVPIVPVKIRGLYKILDPRTSYFRKITITFGKPIIFTNESSLEATQKIRQIISNL